VADLGDGHMGWRFLVSDWHQPGWKSRNGVELVKLEGAEAIQELQRLALSLQETRFSDRQLSQVNRWALAS